MSWEAQAWVDTHEFEKPTTRIVALAYGSHAKGDGRDIFPSLATVAWETGLSRSTVIRARQELERRGILILVSKSGGRRRADEFRMPMEEQRPKRQRVLTASRAPEQVSARHLNRGHGETSNTCQDDTLTFQESNLSREPTPVIPIADCPTDSDLQSEAKGLWDKRADQAEAADDEAIAGYQPEARINIEAGFAAIYALYPRKIARHRAFRAYRAAIRSGGTHEDIRAELMRQLHENRDRELKYWPYLAKWLRDADWFGRLDEQEFDQAEFDAALAEYRAAIPTDPVPGVTQAPDEPAPGAAVYEVDAGHAVPAEALPRAAEPDPEALAAAIHAWNAAAARHGLAAAGAEDLTPAAQEAIACRQARGDWQAAISTLDASPAARRLAPSLSALAALAAEAQRWARFVS